MNEIVTVVESVPVRAQWEIEAEILSPETHPYLRQSLLPVERPKVLFTDQRNVGVNRTNASVRMLICTTRHGGCRELAKCNLLISRLSINRPNPERWLFEPNDVIRWRETLQHCKFAHYLRLSNGRELLIFQNSVSLPLSESWRKREKRLCELGTKTVAKGLAPITVGHFAYTRTGEKLEIMPMSGMPKYHAVHPRFGQPEKILSYETAGKLAPGDMLNGPIPLQLGFDPDFAPYVPAVDGKNAVTNFGTVSIPAFEPTSWESQVFDRCRGFRQAGSGHTYELRVRRCIGRMAGEIEELIEPHHNASPLGKPHRKKKLTGPREGQCYDGPSVRIDWVGEYDIFTVRLGDKLVYYTDSDCFGRALHAWETFEHAVDWARGVNRGGLSRLCLWCLRHDSKGMWQLFLAANEAAYVANLPVPMKNSLIGQPRRVQPFRVVSAVA